MGGVEVLRLERHGQDQPAVLLLEGETSVCVGPAWACPAGHGVVHCPKGESPRGRICLGHLF